MKYFRNVQNEKYAKFNTTQSSPGCFFTQISLRGAIQTICFCTIDTVRAITKKWLFCYLSQLKVLYYSIFRKCPKLFKVRRGTFSRKFPSAALFRQFVFAPLTRCAPFEKKWPFSAFFDISFCRESSWGTRLAKITNRNVS